ncbi:MAG TPA: PH domain-containing protein [Patescibacteria group bacterium]|nr:PH domain-containing protein [Patescibacteria group bacterium]
MSKLLAGETMILETHPHWVTVIKSLVAPVVLVVITAIADFTLLSPDHLYYNFPQHTRLFLTLAVAAIALLWLIVVWIRWQSTTYTLTDQRIKIETGIFSRAEKVVPIDRVQDCLTKQSVFGRMLGYGRVEVDAAGAQGAEVLSFLPNPGNFRDQVFIQSERRRGSAAPGAPASANPGGV